MLRSLGRSLPLLVFCLAACGGDSGEAPAATMVVRDSAGIEIVESDAPTWGPHEAWRLAPEPTVDIGEFEGPPEYQLFGVTGAVRLSGGVAVANTGTHELRFYDDQGRFQHAAGGEGEGPGEFRVLVGVWRIGADLLAVWDPALQRVTMFTSAGQLAGVVRLEEPGANPALIGTFGDGTYLSIDEQFVAPADAHRQQFGELMHHSATGERIGELGRNPTFTSVPVRFADGDLLVSRVVFGPRGVVAAAEQSYFVGDGAQAQVMQHAPDGRLERVVRWREAPRPVTEDHIARYRQQRVAGAGSEAERRRERQIVEQLPNASTFPVYDALQVDGAGRLWVHRFRVPAADQPSDWLVFDPAGALIARAVLPERLHVLDIGAEYLLGVERDELDVERVRLYSLVKP